MARLIVKSPYIKCGGGQNASGYLNYIATRERVEIVPDDRPPTRKQEQLIQKLVKDFPNTKELLEYNDYTNAPTKANASSFITLTLEQNWSRVQSTEGYAKYIATRPRAARLGSHGLFGDADHVSLDTAMDELSHYTGNVWTHIISLKREDAMRLGYDHAAAWRTLLRAHRNDIAAAMNIDPRDFRWYAAFHNEGNHPHVHMMAWSATPGQAYLDRDGIRQIKSTLTNQIFQQELLHLYEEKSVSRDELVHQTRQAMLELAQRMRDGLCICPTAEQKLRELSQKLDDVQGKKVYGYLPKSLKQLTDDTVDAMANLPTVNKCYQKWWELQCQLNDYYSEQQRQRPPLSKQEEAEAFRRLQEHDSSARERLIVHNLRLVVYIAKKFESTGTGVEDLISIGTIGLIKAVNTFKPDKNIKLATYASRCIENEILMFLRKSSQYRNEISIDEPLNIDWDGNELLLSDILGTDDDIVNRGIENEAERCMLREAVDSLKGRERQIMRMRFGLDDGKEKTQKEVADIIGISQSYISRLEKKIIKSLKTELEKKY